MESADGAKVPLLFLCHRIPYPPNKGDKIRSYHLLKYLAKSFDVILGTFIDDDQDWAYEAELEKYCKQRLVLPLSPKAATLRSLKGLVTNQALSVPYYENAQLKRWVRDVVAKQNIEHAIVYSAAMAQFIPPNEFQFKLRIIDFVDVDSDKWRQYAEKKTWPLSYIYKREALKLLTLEKKLCQQFDKSLFVSKAEADMFKTLYPEHAGKVGYYNNGVDREFCNPALSYANPYPNNTSAIVFVGAMDYWPNVDAVVWFAQKVLPLLRSRHPQLQLYIVGGNPAPAVVRLALEAGVEVTGRVEDIRPYLHYALAAVAPMRVARGIQNKVLEAMAMEKIVLVSSLGLEGIPANHGEQILVADEPAEYVAGMDRIIDGEFRQMGDAARHFIASYFDWSESLPEVVSLLNVIDRAPNESTPGVAGDAS